MGTGTQVVGFSRKAPPDPCSKKGGKLFKAAGYEAKVLSVPTDFCDPLFLHFIPSTVYEACRNVQLIPRKAEQNNQAGKATKIGRSSNCVE